MLIDEAEIVFKGGHGGAGIVSFGAKQGSGPDGGNGGRGGDLYVVGSSDLTLLNQFSQQTIFSAENGQMGGKNKMTGKDGKDLEIFLPVGTSLIDTKTSKTLVEVTYPGQRELICKGGKGGKGNWEFRSPRRTTPLFAQSGLPGEEYQLKAVLKVIADYGLVGLPNAGKSSLLNELTQAKAKIGDYAFTTLSPNLGVINGKVIADIPGMIEGASKGKGLGISFLKHIEKVRIVLHCISADSENPLKDYKTIRSEMKNYSKNLISKSEYILITKSDLVSGEKLKDITAIFKKTSDKVVQVSIYDFESIDKLKKILV